jgi:hypothetical protein
LLVALFYWENRLSFASRGTKKGTNF